MKIFQVLLLSILILIVSSAASYKKVIHRTDPEALCLDGSYPALFVHVGSQPNKILIHFEGGGFCRGNTLSQFVQNCYQRSKTHLGSSNYLPETLIAEGYLSTVESQSKFANWTKILIRYCDGSGLQGYTKSTIKYKDAELHFRGSPIIRSHLKWINATYGLETAETVLLGGTSAGGVGVSLWVNYIRQFVKDASHVITMIDSGIFLNVKSSKSQQFMALQDMKTLYKYSNKDESTPNLRCNILFSGEQYKCLSIQYSWTLIGGKILLILSQYDSAMITGYLQVGCPILRNDNYTYSLSNCTISEMKFIEDYRQQLNQFINGFLLTSKNNVWTISCSAHVYTPYKLTYDAQDYRVPQVNGLTSRDALEKFVFGIERIEERDQVGWPDNKMCAN